MHINTNFFLGWQTQTFDPCCIAVRVDSHREYCLNHNLNLDWRTLLVSWKPSNQSQPLNTDLIKVLKRNFRGTAKCLFLKIACVMSERSLTDSNWNDDSPRFPLKLKAAGQTAAVAASGPPWLAELLFSRRPLPRRTNGSATGGCWQQLLFFHAAGVIKCQTQVLDLCGLREGIKLVHENHFCQSSSTKLSGLTSDLKI